MRALLLRIRKLLGRLHNRWAVKFVRHYQELVVGGTIDICPRNLQGIFTVEACSHLTDQVLRSGCYEPELSVLIPKLWKGPGWFVNVGANVGFWAVHVAKSLPEIEQVVAIEPNPHAFKLLIQNVERNQCTQLVRTVEICISERLGTVELACLKGKPEYSSIAAINHPAVRGVESECIQVKSAPLDEVVGFSSQVKLLLIDVEGAEFQVLAGCQNWLRQYQPVIIFECDNGLLSKFGHSVEQLTELLESMGYGVSGASALGKDLPSNYWGMAVARPHKR